MADFQVTLTADEINAQMARFERHVGAQVAGPAAVITPAPVHPDAETIALWAAEFAAEF